MGYLTRRVAHLAAALCFAAACAIGVGATGARAQEAPATPLAFTKTAYFTSKITGALPPVLVREVPPAPVCILVPQLCPPEVDALKTALSLNDGLPLPDVPDFLIPQPVPPGELPVGMLGGGLRYRSLFRFDVPASIAPGSVVNRFDLVIDDGLLAFSIQSPAFRQAIFTALSQYPEQQPEIIARFVEDVTSQATPLAEFEPTGIEACMVTADWQPGESQDPATTPPIDCIVGGLGTHDDNAGTWTFDISGVVQSWLDGQPNNGISLSPVGAQNVAYGDPDPSTNFILTLAPAAAARIDVGPPIDDAPLDVGGGIDDALDSAGSGLGGITDPAIDTLTPPSQTGSSATGGTKRLVARSVDTPWWIWLIFPFVIAGCIALSIALDAVPDLATRRPGALTRLTADHHTRSSS